MSIILFGTNRFRVCARSGAHTHTHTHIAEHLAIIARLPVALSVGPRNMARAVCPLSLALQMENCVSDTYDDADVRRRSSVLWDIPRPLDRTRRPPQNATQPPSPHPQPLAAKIDGAMSSVHAD